MRHAIVVIVGVVTCAACFAETAKVGSRVTSTYDAEAWESDRPRTPGGGVTFRIQNETGDFAVVVWLENKIEGGLSTPDARAKFIKGLSRTNAKAEDVKPVRVFEKDGYQFAGVREVDGLRILFRIMLIVDAGDVIGVVTSSVGEDPLKKRDIEAVWRSVKIH